MQNLNLRTVDNGYILETDGQTLVFTSTIELTAWMNKNHPVPHSLVKVTVSGINRDNQIPVIKLIREYFGHGLREAKDVTDAAKGAGVGTVSHEAELETAQKFKSVVEDTTGALVKLSY